MSNVAPVENEHSTEQSHATRAATSAAAQKRDMGMRERMSARRASLISSNMPTLTAAGVTQLTSTPVVASSLPMVLVRAMSPAFDAAYAPASGRPSLPWIDDILTMRPYP